MQVRGLFYAALVVGSSCWNDLPLLLKRHKSIFEQHKSWLRDQLRLSCAGPSHNTSLNWVLDNVDSLTEQAHEVLCCLNVQGPNCCAEQYLQLQRLVGLRSPADLNSFMKEVDYI